MATTSRTTTSAVDSTSGEDFSVYVGNINPNISKRELLAKLIWLFESLGVVVEAREVEVNRRGRRPMFCFVPTHSEHDQQVAITSLHKTDYLNIAFAGKKLSVNKKRGGETKSKEPKHSPKLSPRKLPPLAQRPLPEQPSGDLNTKTELVLDPSASKPASSSSQKCVPGISLPNEDGLSTISEESDSERGDNFPVQNSPVSIISTPEITRYFVGQRLNTEDRLTEYKRGGGNYVKNQLRIHVAKYMCAFLNSEGGKLLIGISNDCLVHGVPCDRKQEDMVRLEIDQITKGFNPHVFPDRYSIRFLPVFVKDKNGDWQSSERDLKIIEISVKNITTPLGVLYENNRGEVFIRRDGSIQGPLRASQILEWCRLHLVDGRRGSKERLEKEVAIVKDECKRKQEEIVMNLKLVSELSKQKDFVEDQHKLKEEEFKIREMHLKTELEIAKRERNKKSTVCSII